MIDRTVLVLMVLVVVVQLRANGLTYRLSRDVIPQHYSLKLHPHMDNDTFHGEVTITVSTNTAKKNFTLHSNGLNITYASLTQLPAEASLEDRYERISVRLQDEEYIQPGEHQIHLKFEGQLHKQFGLSKRTYQHESRQGFLVVNEFEPTYARKAFPCFDEPLFKARFSIRIVTPNDTYRALSNMPEIARYSTANGIIYDFATSVKMSTYLVSLAITDYPYYEQLFQYNNRTLPIRVYTYNASRENNQYAIEKVKVALKYYTDYTGIEYPLPKLDLIEYNKGAIAATETWGLVQFNQGLLSTFYGEYEEFQRKMALFHEIGHFWFGNLVTNEWWNDLWLQEATATFMSYKILSDLTDVLKLSDLIIDIKSTEMPLIVGYLKSLEDIEKRFNYIVYVKGPYLLKALEAITGEKQFQRAIRSFITKYAFGTATTNTFISEFEEQVPNTDIRSFLESYIYQPGYPVVNVDDSSGNYSLSQIQKPGESYKWTIPISYSHGNNTTGLIWFDKDLDNVQLKKPSDQTWTIFNTIKMPGIYAVNYTETMWTNFLNHIEELPVKEVQNLAINVAMLYHLKYVKCDAILRLLEWKHNIVLGVIFKDIMMVAKDIACFDKEYAILMKYLERQNLKYVSFFLNESSGKCDDVAINGTKVIEPHARECAQWIAENLKEKLSN